MDAAQQPDATDSERTFGEAAQLIVRDAEFDHREAEFRDWVESHALAAWIRATEDLRALDRPPPSSARRRARRATERRRTARLVPRQRLSIE